MKKPPEVLEWISKAEQDYATAEESRIALKTMRKARKFFREKFGLKI